MKLDIYSDRFIICNECGGEGKTHLWNNRLNRKEDTVCLAGNEATMIEVLNALNDARLQLVQWEKDGHEPDDGLPHTVALSHKEGMQVFERRIADLEQRCRELGIHGPAPKADPGDQRRIVDAK